MSNCFPNDLHQFIFSLVYMSSTCFTSLLPLGNVRFKKKNFGYSSGYLVEFHVVLIWFSLMTNNIKYLFMNFLAFHISSFVYCSHIFLIYLKELIISSLMCCRNSLYIMDRSLFSDRCMYCEYFLSIWSLTFCLLNHVFLRTKV